MMSRKAIMTAEDLGIQPRRHVPLSGSDDRLVDQNEAARFLGLSPKTLEQRRWRHEPPAFIRLSTRAVRYRVSDLMAFVAGCRVEPRK